MTNMLEDLLSALRSVPRLPGARCRGQSDLFDERHTDEPEDDWQHRSQTALHLCRTCPALAGCQTWFADLPRHQQPPGVIAGQINQPEPARRPRKKAATA